MSDTKKEPSVIAFINRQLRKNKRPERLVKAERGCFTMYGEIFAPYKWHTFKDDTSKYGVLSEIIAVFSKIGITIDDSYIKERDADRKRFEDKEEARRLHDASPAGAEERRLAQVAYTRYKAKQEIQWAVRKIEEAENFDDGSQEYLDGMLDAVRKEIIDLRVQKNTQHAGGTK